MRNLLILGGLISFILITSCNTKPEGEKAETSEAGEALTSGAKQYQVNTAESKIMWEGAKINKKHNGTINLTSGSLSVDDGVIEAGEFTVDMSSLSNQDMQPGDMKDKLESHLKSADFFDVEQFPTAKFQITKISNLEGDANATHLVYGNLTMKNITKEIGFKANVDVSPSGVSVVTPPFTIDRSEWDVRYGSDKFFDDLKDNAINNEIGLQVNLKAS